MDLNNPVPKYGADITTVDPANTLGTFGFVLKGDAQERQSQIVFTPAAFRWPMVGEAWMLRKENGTWEPDGMLPPDGFWDIPPGDLMLNSPTGVLHVLGDPNGITDFQFDQSSVYVPGDLISSAAASRPGCLLCDGATYLRVDHPELYAAIHPNYHIDADHLRVPDLRGRTAIGAGTGTAAGATAHTVGAQPTSGSGGEEQHTLSVGEMPTHDHHIQRSALQAASGGGGGIFGLQVNSGTDVSSTQVAGSSFGHNIMQPVSVINWFIKT